MRQLWPGLTFATLAACSGANPDFSETSIADLHDQMQRGEISSVELVDWYIERIETTRPGRARS